jgi:hypothetical protein
VLGRRTTRKREEWFEEDCDKRTESKNQARNRWLKTGNLKDLENYKEKRKEATKYCKHKKESWIRNSTSKKTQRIDNKRWETYYTELLREAKKNYREKKRKSGNGRQ